jgi:hypothetical protein
MTNCLIIVNEALRTRFLDLKEGAIVVSLKPFVSSLNARVTERNVSACASSGFPHTYSLFRWTT